MSKKQTVKKGPTFMEVDGDVIDLFFQSTTDAAIIHGANCQKVMGAGIAAQIREKLAPMYYLDQFDNRTPTQRFGNYSAVVVGQVENSIKIGANIYTQYQPGANFNLNALINGLRCFAWSIPKDKRAGLTIYTPKIGCGIGGGKWEDIKPVIMKELEDFNVVVVNYKEVKPVFKMEDDHSSTLKNVKK